MERKFGILMPVFSLGGKEGIGTFGKAVYEFVDFLSACGVGLWQVLPLCPIGCGGSPYSSPCENAINPYFIDLMSLVDKRLLTSEECQNLTKDFTRVNYELIEKQKIKLLKKAYARFCGEVSGYDDYALFMAIKEWQRGAPWYEWGKLAQYDSQAVRDFAATHQEQIRFWQFTQTVANEQWMLLKDYANQKGVSVIGDMPFYVSLDSVEVWTNKAMFELDGYIPTVVAGVPPDYFSKTGQLWGNPIYKWNDSSCIRWWNDRIFSAMSRYDMLRLDHFRAFDEYYTVKYGSKDATKGEWKKGVGYEFFAGKKHLPIIAEDLGIITDSVRALLSKTGYPGMRVLQFGFDGSGDNPHLASNIGVNCVCYTGTHDNMTLKQFVTSLDGDQLGCLIAKLSDELGERLSGDVDELVDAIIELGCSSDAKIFIVPMADLMLKGADYRINTPSTVSDLNWSVRIKTEDITKQKERLKALVVKYNRTAKNNLTK